jgi:hypothetical protein
MSGPEWLAGVDWRHRLEPGVSFALCRVETQGDDATVDPDVLEEARGALRAFPRRMRRLVQRLPRELTLGELLLNCLARGPQALDAFAASFNGLWHERDLREVDDARLLSRALRAAANRTVSAVISHLEEETSDLMGSLRRTTRLVEHPPPIRVVRVQPIKLHAPPTPRVRRWPLSAATEAEAVAA